MYTYNISLRKNIMVSKFKVIISLSRIMLRVLFLYGWSFDKHVQPDAIVLNTPASVIIHEWMMLMLSWPYVGNSLPFSMKRLSRHVATVYRRILDHSPLLPRLLSVE